MPVYDDSLRPWWMIHTGLGLYDLFSRQPEYHCRHIPNQNFAQKFPGIKTEGLRRVYVYYDGKTNDLEITRRIAQDAVDSGGAVRENCQVVSVDTGSKSFAVLYRDGSGEHRVEAPLLINATGPWIDEVNAQYHLPHNYRINKVSGIHIVINRALVPVFTDQKSADIFYDSLV